MQFSLKSKILLLANVLYGLFGVSLTAQNSIIYTDSAKNALVLIETDYGSIKIRLYDQTPLHRDRFVKLASEGFYDGLLFHRVIEGFMIQGGDPDSRSAKPGQLLGDGDLVKLQAYDFERYGFPFSWLVLPYYDWIPAEFNKDLFHKRGVLAAARESDDKNPEKKSSGCQFYITQGRGPLTDKDLGLYEWRINKKLRTGLKSATMALRPDWKTRYEKFKNEKQNDSLMKMEKQLDSLIAPFYKEIPHYTFSDEQIKAYKRIGGTPHLDGNYTVYGEVIYGMEAVDKIAKLPTDKNDRPANDVKMKVTVLRRPKS